MHEGREGRGGAKPCGDRAERERGPRGGDLAVMAMPKATEQKRSRRDRQKDADERQCPRPCHGRAVKLRCCVSRRGWEHQGCEDGNGTGSHRDMAALLLTIDG